MKILRCVAYLLVFLGIALSACDGPGQVGAEDPSDQTVGLANPASVYCTESGYAMEIRTDESGAQYGVCIFDDGTECEEWAYYRGECGPVVRPAELPEFVIPVRDAVIATVRERYPDVNLPDPENWETGVSSSSASARAKTFRLTSGNWMMTIRYPVVPPESATPLTFTIFLSNLHPEEAFYWRGEVDEQGILNEITP